MLCLISQGPTLIPSNHSLAGHELSFPVIAISFSSLVLDLQYFVSTDHQRTSTSMILTLKSNHQCLQGERSCLQSPILKNRETHIYCWWNTEQRNRSQVFQGLPMSSMRPSGRTFEEFRASSSRPLCLFSFHHPTDTGIADWHHFPFTFY